MNLTSVNSLVGNLDLLEDPLAVLKALAIHAPVGVQIYSAAGFTLYTNEQHARIFGGPPPLNYCVLEDENVRAAGTLHLVKKAFDGEPEVLPVFWYDPRVLEHLLGPEEREYVKRVGKKAAIETHMIPVRGCDEKVAYVIFVFRDVTAEQYMRESQQQAVKERDDTKLRFQSILDNTKAVVYIKDVEGKYLFANGQFCRIFGKSAAEVLGKRDHDLFSPELADEFRENDFQVLRSRAHLEAEEVAVHHDGSAHTYISLKFPLEDSAGELYGLCGISTDITAHRQLERELNTAKRMEALGLLAGGIAHDFNNILGIIQLVADTITMSGAARTPELKIAMGTIKDATQRATALTRRLLAFGRKQIFQPRTLDLVGVVCEMESMLGKALGEDILFQVELAPDLWMIRADPMQIEQILTNLAFNAKDSMTKGGSLKISAQNTTITADRGHLKIGKIGGEFVELTVADSGCGIDPGVLERIFEPFFTTKPEGQGAGLGLATVYGIVQSMGGGVIVDSAPGRGSVFRVLFPRDQGVAVPERAKHRKIARPKRGTETILLVEDQPDLRRVTAALLRERGYAVIEVTDGQSALSQWKEIASKVDLVMTDIVMPGMSGLEMVRTMANRGDGPALKSLFVSGYSAEKLSDYGFDPEKNALIAKPFSATVLLEKLREILEPGLPG